MTLLRISFDLQQGATTTVHHFISVILRRGASCLPLEEVASK